MQLLARKRVIAHRPSRAPVIAFVSYIHPTQPTLLRRHGWEIADDLHDDLYDIISHDNGQTWSDPTPSLKKQQIDGGYKFTYEGGAIYLPERDLLVSICDQSFQPSLDGHTMGYPIKLHITASKPGDRLASQPLITDFGIPQGLAVSFTHPTVDAAGRILVPVQLQQHDTDGSLRRHGVAMSPVAPDVARDFGTSGLMIGTFDAAGQLSWRLGGLVKIEYEKSSRGLYEPAVAQLRDRRLVMVLRGSNHRFPDKPGYKWVSFSDDGAQSWSVPAPLACDDGACPESSATGSALIRSDKTGRLYWIGNLCRPGQRAQGNFPRSPLVIARVREEPFALERDSITLIDQHGPGEDESVQHSNFRLYQDRATGDIVLYLTRYGERGSANNAWLNADHYEYRVQID